MRRFLLVAAIVLIVIFVLAAIAWAQVSPTVQPSLAQPMTFPHNTHVKAASLDCTFCHRQTTSVSPTTAGYPSLEQCMFCHRVVATDRPRIQQLREAYESGKGIDWVRVVLIPDHVHFVHQPHIAAGFECVNCHGEVGEMVQVVQAKSPTMGFCLDCHRANNARTDCSVCHY